MQIAESSISSILRDFKILNWAVKIICLYKEEDKKLKLFHSFLANFNFVLLIFFNFIYFLSVKNVNAFRSLTSSCLYYYILLGGFLENLQRQRWHNLLGQSALLLGCPRGEKVFPYIESKSLVSLFLTFSLLSLILWRTWQHPVTGGRGPAVRPPKGPSYPQKQV